jgi:hypothetical protein
MLGMIFETGHPWMTFKDPCNLRSPQQHCGVVHSSNLCTEITLNTNSEEIAVCNLGSVNLPQHIENGELNLDKLRKHRAHGDPHARQRDRYQLLLRATGENFQLPASPHRPWPDGLPGRALQDRRALRHQTTQ